MNYRQLGHSGLLVSELCLGGMVLDGGINFFDTADVYSYGQSEEILGRALKAQRHEVVCHQGAWPHEFLTHLQQLERLIDEADDPGAIPV